MGTHVHARPVLGSAWDLALDTRAAVLGAMSSGTAGSEPRERRAIMKVEESIVIHRSPEEMFAFFNERTNNKRWMASVVEDFRPRSLVRGLVAFARLRAWADLSTRSATSGP